MSKIIDEFKAFAIKGNMIDMAVGIIIGSAFGKIVSSFVSDVIMPPLGVLIGGVDFSNLKIVIKKAVDDVPAVTLNYGSFIQVCIDFLIIAWVIFVFVKGLNSMKKKEAAAPPPPPAPPAPSKEELLLTEIRDLLKKQSVK
jgi:large conductance mechanosensitive channel